MGDVKTVLTQLDRACETKQFYIKVLGLWAHLEETTGLTHEDVRAFTFRPEYLTPQQRNANRVAAAVYGKPPVYCDKNWHNCVRLREQHMGDLREIPGIARPIPPEHLKADARIVDGL